MTRSATNFFVKQYLKTRAKRINSFIEHPHKTQNTLLNNIIDTFSNTAWGRKHEYEATKSSQDFKRRLNIITYEELYPWIAKMIEGEADVLVPGLVTQFSKSSGTTNDASKYIPLSNRMLSECHDMASWDVLHYLYKQKPELKIFHHKNLIMAGSVSNFEQNENILHGDISAITLNNLPQFSRPYYTPDFETALLDDWEEKIDKMTVICSNEEVTMLAGVPSWTMVLLQKILKYKSVPDMSSLWPEASVYIHGGVGFQPYRNTFERFFPDGNLDYMEVYNASEGFFAFQDRFERDDMLLMLNHGIYYEFIPQEEIGNENPATINLMDIELGQTYGLVITTLSGLARYRMGDTITFTSKDPYRIKVMGRESQFINVFGEELMVANAETALTKVCTRHHVSVIDYTVAPVYMTDKNKGGHQWLIEFEKNQPDLKQFAHNLDLEIQKLNSDYKAKRTASLAMNMLDIVPLKSGTFYQWMKQKSKLGGQHKVPRLYNDRLYADDILNFVIQYDEHE